MLRRKKHQRERTIKNDNLYKTNLSPKISFFASFFVIMLNKSNKYVTHIQKLDLIQSSTFDVIFVFRKTEMNSNNL